MMNLAQDQPLEVALRERPWRQENWIGGCWWGTRDAAAMQSGSACRKNPAPGSLTGLCEEHVVLLQAWDAGMNVPDPRPEPWHSNPENTGMFPDMYLNGVLIG